MNDLEDRLRSTLGDRAESLAPSTNPRADLAIRLARRERRRPLLAVAAAVVVIAAIAVPVVLTHRTGPNPPVATTPASVPPAWVELAPFTENGVSMTAGLAIDRDGRSWCIEKVAAGSQPVPVNCYGVPDWGRENVPEDNRYVVSVSVLGGDEPALDYVGPLPKLRLFMTSPEVKRLTVEGRRGVPVTVNEVARTARAAYFLVVVKGDQRGNLLWYTAMDARGKRLAAAHE
jgi:hypothetical protein